MDVCSILHISKALKKVYTLGTSQPTSRQHLPWESHCTWVFIEVLVLIVRDWKQPKDTIVEDGFDIMMRYPCNGILQSMRNGCRVV